MSWPARSRSFIIVLTVLLMASGILVIGEWLRSGTESATVGGELLEPAVRSRLVNERSGFGRADVAHDYLRSAEGGSRTLSEFYRLRAYYMAPPSVPHPIAANMTVGGDLCLTCHRDGGFVPKWDAYAPVTPHPEFRNCRQCHNPRLDEGTFVASDFSTLDPPELDGNPLPGGPPPMPHPLQLRENCLACHAGPGAVSEIRTTHPDRVNCRQCHAQNVDHDIWKRPGGLEGRIQPGGRE